MFSTPFFYTGKKKKVKNANVINFNKLSEEYNSFSITNDGNFSNVNVKIPSKVLPSDHTISYKDAFHMGAKQGTGISLFHKFIPKIKEIFKRLPPTKRGKIADLVHIYRNDVRTLHQNISILFVKLNAHFYKFSVIERDVIERDIIGGNIGDNEKIEFYRKLYKYMSQLRVLINSLEETLMYLKMYNALLKGNATIGVCGFIVQGKDPPEPPPHLLIKRKKRESLYNDEYIYLTKFQITCQNNLHEIQKKMSGLKTWREKNEQELKIEMNRAKCAGEMLGIGIQGSVTSFINLGIAIGTINPVIFAAAAYYGISTIVRIIEIGVKTHAENQVLRHTPIDVLEYKNTNETNEELNEETITNELNDETITNELNDETITNELNENNTKEILNLLEFHRKKSHSIIKGVGHVEKVHNIVDGLSNTGFGVCAVFFTLPVSTARPATTTPRRNAISNQ
jgi:hypothetical protein